MLKSVVMLGLEPTRTDRKWRTDKKSCHYSKHSEPAAWDYRRLRPACTFRWPSGVIVISLSMV